MDPKRQGEIALELVKYYIGNYSITLLDDKMPMFEHVAKTIGVSVKELRQFTDTFAQKLLEKRKLHRQTIFGITARDLIP